LMQITVILYLSEKGKLKGIISWQSYWVPTMGNLCSSERQSMRLTHMRDKENFRDGGVVSLKSIKHCTSRSMFYWHPIGCTKEMIVLEQIKVTLCHCSQAILRKCNVREDNNTC
jgi:hypothetical protein